MSGRLYDDRTREPLVGAAVKCPVFGLGTVTDALGRFEMALPDRQDSFPIAVSYPGYHDLLHMVNADTANVQLNLSMTLEGNALQEVVVQAFNPLRDRLTGTQMSFSQLSAAEAKALPSLLGEVDLIKTLQLKPGILPGPEGSSGLYVRGGSSDQNLFLLDDAVVYSPNHLFGFFSTFNADAVEHVGVYKGGFPAQYGGRLSAVLDVETQDGNNNDFGVSGGLGLITSRLTVEGPIQKGKHSFRISGRRTYADLITRSINRLYEDVKDYNPIPDYHFYDLNAKLSFTLSPKDQLSWSGYFGQDKFNLLDKEFDVDFSWGNAASSIQWKRVLSDHWSSSLSLVYSRYSYLLESRLDGFHFHSSSGIQDLGMRAGFLYAPNQRHRMRFGLDATERRLSVARLNIGSDDEKVRFSAGQEFYGVEWGAYAVDELTIGKRLKTYAGLRASAWIQGGKTYLGLEPRLSANFMLTPKWAIKAGYARMSQYVHLLGGTGLSLPTDLWYPTTAGVKPQRSHQVTIGSSYLIADRYLVTWEAWYKRLQNQIDFIDGADLYTQSDIESQLVAGNGFAYSPLELEIEKTSGKVKGWVGYTLAWAKRGDFEGINGGRYYPQRYDARHNASLVLSYQTARRWKFSGTLVYTSGYAAWLPEGRFSFLDIPGVAAQPLVPVYGDRNNFRYPDYLRLDLAAVWQLKSRRGFKQDITFSLYNATGRRNPYFIYLDPEFETITVEGREVEVPKSIKAKQVSLFPALPSVTWNFKF